MPMSIVVGFVVGSVGLLIAIGTLVYKLGAAISMAKAIKNLYEHNLPKLWEANTALIQKITDLELELSLHCGRDSHKGD